MVFWNLSLTLRIYSQSSSWSDLVKKELDCSTSLHKNFQWFPISYRMNSKFFLWPKAPYNNLSPHYLLQLISFYFPPVSLCPRTVAMLLYLEHARYLRAEALVFFLGCLTVFFFLYSKFSQWKILWHCISNDNHLHTSHPSSVFYCSPWYLSIYSQGEMRLG